MKKILMPLFITAVMNHCALAQNKIVKYCEVVSRRYNKFSINVSPSKIDSLFSFVDSCVKINLNKVSTFNTVPDALNYMSSLGWTLLTVTMASWGGTTEVRFYFKKEFDQSEISK